MLTTADEADRHLREVLVSLAGPEATPRADQGQAVRALVVDGARVLVVQATGWGKSAVYWAATSALRASGSGLTLVVSPLLALMRDQVTAAERAGLRAATINSTNLDAWDDVLAAIDHGSLDVLLVSPERLANPRFAARLPALLANTGMVVIDEAHCISDWGFDFRPDYQRLARHLLTLSPGTPVLATTATANSRVSEDVAHQLGADTQTFRGSLARTSLQLSVVPGLGSLERWAWVADALATTEGSGIIYTLTVAETERLAGFLSACGHRVAAYSGRLDPEARMQVEDQLRSNELKAVVATSALGMGYDKPDLAFCIHVGSPPSPVAYYQQVGRAGRALENALAVLLPSESDEPIWEYFATASIPVPEDVDRVLAVLEKGPASVASLENIMGLRRNRLDGMLKLLAAYDVVEKQGTEWLATGERYQHDHQKWSALRAMRNTEADIMRDYASGRGCLMQFLQVALDDPEPSPCGRCSVCTGSLPAPGSRPTEASMMAAKNFARTVDVIIEPRKLWPSGMTGRKGRIVGCDNGRALAFADDPGWVSELKQMALGDAPIDRVVADGLVAVLTRWRTQWPARPVAVVPIPSRRHPLRVGSLAEHIAQIGKLPLLDAFVATGVAPPTDTASAARVNAIASGLTLRDDIEIPRGPVLLVDDTYRSGWTMTLAAALLRSAGATAVLPLVVHQLP
jgi:ATP-dependent DNA helicase RecQ